MAAGEAAEQIVEREVRELVRQRGLDPGDGDAATVRRLIDELVAEYQERGLTASMPPLPDPAQVAKWVADQVIGLGPLQPFFDDEEVEEVWINEPGKVFTAKAGRPVLTTTVLTEEQVHDLVELMLRSSGRRVDLSSPSVQPLRRRHAGRRLPPPRGHPRLRACADWRWFRDVVGVGSPSGTASRRSGSGGAG